MSSYPSIITEYKDKLAPATRKLLYPSTVSPTVRPLQTIVKSDRIKVLSFDVTTGSTRAREQTTKQIMDNGKIQSIVCLTQTNIKKGACYVRLSINQSENINDISLIFDQNYLMPDHACSWVPQTEIFVYDLDKICLETWSSVATDIRVNARILIES